VRKTIFERAVSGAGLISAERQRQIERENFTAAHDDQHSDGDLVRAAVAYIDPNGPFKWPDGRAPDFTKHGHVERLVIAGALLAAEIDRLLRQRAATEGGEDV